MDWLETIDVDQALLILLVGALLVAGGVTLYGWLKRRREAADPGDVRAGAPPPAGAHLYAAHKRFVYDAIFAGFKMSDWALDTLGERLDGIDKKWFADSLYDVLPDQIGRFDLAFVKRLVPREEFARLVQQTYDELRRDWLARQGHWEDLFRDWLEANKPEAQDEPPEKPEIAPTEAVGAQASTA